MLIYFLTFDLDTRYLKCTKMVYGKQLNMYRYVWYVLMTYYICSYISKKMLGYDYFGKVCIYKRLLVLNI